MAFLYEEKPVFLLSFYSSLSPTKKWYNYNKRYQKILETQVYIVRNTNIRKKKNVKLISNNHEKKNKNLYLSYTIHQFHLSTGKKISINSNTSHFPKPISIPRIRRRLKKKSKYVSPFFPPRDQLKLPSILAFPEFFSLPSKTVWWTGHLLSAAVLRRRASSHEFSNASAASK